MSPLLELLLIACYHLLASTGRGLSRLYEKLSPALGLRYYDHRYNWLGGPKAWQWAERGFYAYLIAKRGGTILDLCCGDGFYPALFLSRLEGEIDALDSDHRAIVTAQKRYRRPRLRFLRSDILIDSFPRVRYDTVTCFATLQYFTPKDTMRLMQKIAEALSVEDGVFGGSVPIVEPPCEPDSTARQIFRSVAEVRCMLHPHFAQVDLWCSVWQPGLTYCYFKCSKPRVHPSKDLDAAIDRCQNQFS